MVLDWFRGAKALTNNELILRKDYEKSHVREVLQEFHAQPADSTIEATIRSMPRP